MNVSSGRQAGVAVQHCQSAFINGIKAFGIDDENATITNANSETEHNQVISESKFKILKAIDETTGGFVESLEQLEAISGLANHY